MAVAVGVGEEGAVISTCTTPPNFYLPDTQHHIDFEIEHIIIPSVGYQSHLCLDLLLVDCRTHVTVGDEMVCGTDGVTYANQ